MKRVLIAAVILVGLAVTAPLAAQEQTKAQEKPTASSGTQVPLNVHFVLSRYLNDKKISSLPYMLGVLSGGQKTSLRIGTSVPIVRAGRGSSETPEGTQQSISYREVGTDIDCQAVPAAGGSFSLNITVEDSSMHVDKTQATDRAILRDVPAFRSFKASFGMVLRDGQSMQYASATDPVSGEVIRIDVTLNTVK